LNEQKILGETKLRIYEICSCSQCKNHPQRPKCPSRQPHGCCLIYMVNGEWRLSATTTDYLNLQAEKETELEDFLFFNASE